MPPRPPPLLTPLLKNFLTKKQNKAHFIKENIETESNLEIQLNVIRIIRRKHCMGLTDKNKKFMFYVVFRAEH